MSAKGETMLKLQKTGKRNYDVTFAGVPMGSVFREPGERGYTGYFEPPSGARGILATGWTARECAEALVKNIKQGRTQ